MNYFTLREIYKNCTPAEIHLAKQNKDVQRNIRKLRDILNIVRERVDMPIYVNSWYRDSEHNKRVGGVINSHHLLGGAADIRCEHLHSLLDVLLTIPEITQIIGYGSFIHISIINTKNNRFYDKRTIKQD